jgi:hypothetical protein
VKANRVQDKSARDIVGLGRQNESARARNADHFINDGTRIGHVD